MIFLWCVYMVINLNFFFPINGSNACKQTITSLNIYVEQYQHTCPAKEKMFMSIYATLVHFHKSQ